MESFAINIWFEKGAVADDATFLENGMPPVVAADNDGSAVRIFSGIGEDSIDVVCSEAGLVKMLFEEEGYTVLVLRVCRDQTNIDNADALGRGRISGVANVSGDGSGAAKRRCQRIGRGTVDCSIKTE